MPTYVYACDDASYDDLHMEVVQSILSDPFVRMGQISEHIDSGGYIDVYQKTEIDDKTEVWEKVDGFFVNDDAKDISCYQVFTPPNFIFKGSGWTSKGNVKYTGKHQKRVEELREKRQKRLSKNVSLVDVGVTDSVTGNKKWDRMSDKQKSIARQIGVVPAKETV